MIDSIIFDVDGTLWDATKEIQVSWNKALKGIMGIDRVIGFEELQAQLGKPVPTIFDNLFPDEEESNRRSIEHTLTDFENEWVKTAPCIIYEGVASTIKTLAERFPVFIISNCQSGYIEAFLENTGLGPWVKDFTCPGYTGKEKGDNILIMMERHGLIRPAYVGDTVGDMQASDYANVPFIYASYGYGQIESPQFYINTFSDLVELDYESM